jgi:plasmid maintenance system antidote protein VapI
MLTMKSGPEQFKDWMHRRRFLQTEAAEYLGFHFTFVSQLVGGKRTPGLENAIAIERLTGIPVEAWLPMSVDKPKDDALATAGTGRKDKA